MIPSFVYKNEYKNVEKDFSRRKNLIFVGDFLQASNVDGMNWFSKEIYPKIIEKFPDIILHITGSDIPYEIIKLKSKNIKIDGFLRYEDLMILYQKCRIAIVPLRFGNGINAQILDAANNQIPIVTTSIGAEGLDDSIGAFIIEDKADNMCKKICQLYINYDKLEQMSNNGKVLIDKYFSINKTIEIIKNDFK